jgi:hypothetical protein
MEERIFEQVIFDGVPVKFFLDLEFEPQLFQENSEKEGRVSEMILSLKKFVQELWEKDTKSEAPLKYWVQLDSTRAEKKVSRHLFNDGMVFKDIDHLYTFVKRLQTMLNDECRKKNEAAIQLIISRQKYGQKKKEYFFDMQVYNKHHNLRLPWSTKLGEGRHFYVVDESGQVRRDQSNPQWEIFQRILVNYWPKGAPPVQPFEYSDSDLAQRSSKPSAIQSPFKNKSAAPKSQFQLTIENALFGQIRREAISVPSKFLNDQVIIPLLDTKSLFVECGTMDNE